MYLSFPGRDSRSTSTDSRRDSLSGPSGSGVQPGTEQTDSAYWQKKAQQYASQHETMRQMAQVRHDSSDSQQVRESLEKLEKKLELECDWDIGMELDYRKWKTLKIGREKQAKDTVWFVCCLNVYTMVWWFILFL